MFAQLGNIRFTGLKGFTAFSDTRATNYAEIERIGIKPVLQRVGESLETLSLSILLHADFSNVEQDFKELDDARKAGRALPLVLGNGSVLGDFLLVSISRNIRKAADDGSIIYLTADLELKEADVSNRLLLQEVQAKQAAFANSLEKVIPTAEVAVKQSEGVQAGAISQSINVQAIKADSLIEQANNNPTAKISLLQELTSVADLASIAALEVANKVRKIQGEISNATAIIENAEALAIFAIDLKVAAQTGDLSQVASANSTFQTAQGGFKASVSTLIQLIALRKI